MHVIIWIIIALAIFILLLIILRCITNRPKTYLKPDMTGKVIIVTGSNSGIGKVAALTLLSRGARVIFASRDESKTQAVIDSIKDIKLRQNASYIKLDISSFESINLFVREFKENYPKCDILINNAGATIDKFELKDKIESTIMTNHIGPVCLTALLLDSINPKGKVINVSSMAHKWVTSKDLNQFFSDDDFIKMKNSYDLLKIYYISKLGNIYHTKTLDMVIKLRNLEIKTAALNPGLVYTNLFSTRRYSSFVNKIKFFCFIPVWWLFSKDVEMGAQTTLHLAYIDYDEMNSGAYFSDCKEEKLGELPSDQKTCIQFMKYTRDLIKNNIRDIPGELSEYFKSLKSEMEID